MVIYKKKIPTVDCTWRKMVYTVMNIVCKIAFKLQFDCMLFTGMLNVQRC